MRRRMFLQSFSASSLAASATATMQAGQVAGQPSHGGDAEKIVLTEKEYFEGPGFVCLVFHNHNSGMQGGLQIIQKGERLLDSGGLLLTTKAGVGGRGSSASVLRRVVDRDRSTATVFGEVRGLDVAYQLICRTDGRRMFVTLKLERALDWSRIREAGFRIFLYPPAYFQKSFQGDSATGVFPRQFTGEPVLARSRDILRIAGEDPMVSVTFERRGGELRLEDGRRERTEVGAHARDILAIERQRHSRLYSHLAERAVALVMEEEVVELVAGDEDVRPAAMPLPTLARMPEALETSVKRPLPSFRQRRFARPL